MSIFVTFKQTNTQRKKEKQRNKINWQWNDGDGKILKNKNEQFKEDSDLPIMVTSMPFAQWSWASFVIFFFPPLVVIT
jgi:hypothetical protein